MVAPDPTRAISRRFASPAGCPSSFSQIRLAAEEDRHGGLRIVLMLTPAQPAAAFDPRQPFSRAEARAAGLTAEMLLGRQFHKICWDTYVAREVPITPLLRAKAVIRLVPSGVVRQPSHGGRAVGCGSAGRRGHARHAALRLWAIGSPRRSLALPQASSADHASQGRACLHASADFPGPCGGGRRVG